MVSEGSLEYSVRERLACVAGARRGMGIGEIRRKVSVYGGGWGGGGSACSKLIVWFHGNIKADRLRVLGRWLGYVNFTKIIFGVGSRFPKTSAFPLRVEVRFIDESDFVNKRKGFVVKVNPE